LRFADAWINRPLKQVKVGAVNRERVQHTNLGPGFAGDARDRWVYSNRVTLRRIRVGMPTKKRR
jgi:hypothetical protein